MLNSKVHTSTAVLVTIGLFDLVTTLMWLNQGFGEGNPLFRWLASHGTAPFVLGKILFLVGPVLLLEYARKTHPKSAEQGTWIAAGFYLLFYGSHVAALLRG
ncbi:MAG TPA: DUF5658 family protein [Fimbriimonadaceae bacterium]|nr:DUF5658 family protein [Fimbriimonadaceae bacterium]